MNILITGGCGFVGYHLTKRLKQEGHTIYVLDNYFTGRKTHIVDDVEYKYGETSDIFSLYYLYKIDIIYHLGEYSRVEQSFEDIDIVFKYNWKSIYEVLKLADAKNSKLVYSGSSTKFGDDGNAKFTSPYAYTKYMNVDLIKTYADWFCLDYAITYFYNVYGPNEIQDGKYATVIAKFLKLVSDGATSLPINGNGEQRRNFTHINDIVEGLVLVGLYGTGDNYGIGSSISYSINELVDMFGLDKEYKDDVKGNRKTAPVMTEKTKLLGWKEKYNLVDYIKEELIKINI